MRMKDGNIDKLVQFTPSYYNFNVINHSPDSIFNSRGCPISILSLNCCRYKSNFSSSSINLQLFSWTKNSVKFEDKGICDESGGGADDEEDDGSVSLPHKLYNSLNSVFLVRQNFRECIFSINLWKILVISMTQLCI